MRLHSLSSGLFSRFLSLVLAASMATTPAGRLNAQQAGVDPQRPEAPEVVQAPIAAEPGITRRQGGDKTLLAAPDAGKIDLTYVTPQAVAIATIRPQQILHSQAARTLPVEVASAAGLEHFGLDPGDVEEVVAFSEAPLPGAPQYGVILRLAKPLTLDRIQPRVKQHTQPADLDGRAYLKSTQLALPSFYMPDDRTLLAMPEATLRRVVAAAETPPTSPLFDRARTVGGGNDLYVALDVATLRPLVNPLIAMAVAKEGKEFPEEMRPLLEAPNLIAAAELTLNLSNARSSSLVVHGNDEASAQKLESIVDQVAKFYRAQVKAETDKLLASKDPIEHAYGQYMQRMSEEWTTAATPVRQGSTFTLFRTPETTSPEYQQQQQLMNIAVVGVLVALLLPAIQAAREAARRNQAVNNLKQQVLGLHVYADAKKTFPAHAIYSVDGKPLLSWRVAILPYIDQQGLYDLFHLDEPWDSPHNKPLVAMMPELFQSPGFENHEGKTSYLAVVGKECVFNGTKTGLGFREIPDGTSKTILLVEANPDQAVEWTKPADLQIDPRNPAAGLGSMRPGGWNAAWADGSVMIISNSIDPKTLNAVFTRDGKEVIDPDAF